jgi:hypothetical protein
MNKFTWRGAIEFSGTAEEFDELSEVLKHHRVGITIPEMGQRRSIRGLGGAPSAINKVLSEALLQGLVAGQTHLSLKFNQDLPGGIRTPHLHTAADVVLLDSERFKTYVNALTTSLVERRVDLGDDYVGILGDLNQIASSPVPQPVP